MKENCVIYIVVPCYNEEEVLPETTRQLMPLLEDLMVQGKISRKSRILYVNDGSKDGTWQIISRLYREHEMVSGVNLSRNRGHQNAVLAGLMYAKEYCDAAITMDADLQDDINAINEMVDKFRGGMDVVYGVRSSRRTDTFFKKFTAEGFYRLMEWMGVDIIFNHADYRLMSARALEGLASFQEVNLFLRGIVPQIGLENDVVTYSRDERVAGESKYPLAKMLSFSIDGITSFSARPMRWIFMTGLVLLVVALLVAVYVFTSYFYSDHISAGWASIMLSIWVLGSMILIAIGIVGEYIGKIFNEVKHRPRYAVADEVWD